MVQNTGLERWFLEELALWPARSGLTFHRQGVQNTLFQFRRVLDIDADNQHMQALVLRRCGTDQRKLAAAEILLADRRHFDPDAIVPRVQCDGHPERTDVGL